jgi:hypothetical protein
MSDSTIPGVRFTRREVFRSETKRSMWAMDMLTAITAAKGMGATQFEVVVGDEQVTEKPTYDFVGGGLYDFGRQRVQTGSYTERSQEVIIYAVVAEDAP